MARFEEEVALTFDDVVLVPQYSEVVSRKLVYTTTQVGGRTLKVPILSANMDTVTGLEMAKVMDELGGMGVLHRFASAEQQLAWVKELGNKAVPSIGVHADDLVRAESYRKYTSAICVDIAHGHNKLAGDTVEHVFKLGFSTIIAGNIATADGAEYLVSKGANVVKVGVSPGSMCTTRVVTGHGYPQLSAITQVAKRLLRYPYITLVADGGIRNSGDIVKSIAAGADAVMIGGLFAGSDETPGELLPVKNGKQQKLYRGSASESAQKASRGFVSNDAPEGEHTYVDAKGPVKDIVANLMGGLRSGMSYAGAFTLHELQQNAVFARITANGLAEGKPHGMTR